MKTLYRNKLLGFCYSIFLLGFISCQKNSHQDNGGGTGLNNPVPVQTDVDFYLTKGNQSVLLQKQNAILAFKTTSNGYPDILVDTTLSYQTVDGFGFTLTDGSASLIYNLPTSMQNDLLNELFGSDSTSISISYLRVSIGASDLSASVYTYNDMPAGQTDMNLENFSLRKDQSNVIHILKKILAINPNIKILGSPWTAPTWMKSNNNSIGGSLLPQYYSVYANYFVKYIQAMKAEGVTIDAITPQNEPLYGGNNPSMLMTAMEQANFIKNHLGPAFQAASINTKIITYDHNADRPDYPLTVLDDAGARQYVDGSAFHLYGGDISALSIVHEAYPAKHLYFTEQYTSSNGDFAGDLKWHLKNIIIGSMRNWSRNALEWNLASDPYYSIHTTGGCTTCKGAITIISGVTRNVGYYIIAHASKFVPPGSQRVASNIEGSLYNVAFNRPDGKKVLIVENDGANAQTFNINFNGRRVTSSLDAGAVGTYIW
ncbi:glucosylceramidase [Chitinophagaceae bacterium LB-8]|uniref:Glucosylceramidase n=1 Tax=Paraflavisolibacter caeni TaxID=2982496 RepID=A0A9X2XV58_9BACT|nr:glycoside hydrolase family 30 beta sandwich domain-containing protein [Paraflavisolibacter caeni]MCU7549701.1 glucosylceramidase [Paraflavisolibacter caeni]